MTHRQVRQVEFKQLWYQGPFFKSQADDARVHARRPFKIVVSFVF